MSTRIWTTLSLSIASGILLYVLMLLFWGIDRGFDLRDEGFYLLVNQHPEQYHLISDFKFWTMSIPAFTSCRVLDFRWAQIICQIIGSVWLANSFVRALVRLDVIRDKALLISAVALSVLGGLMLFAKFPFSISYNALTFLFLYGATALIIDAAPLTKPFISQSLKNTRQKLLMMFAAGILCGFTFSVKAPSFLIFAVCALALIALLSGRAFRKLAAAFGFGTVFAFTLTCVFFVKLGEWWHELHYFMNYQKLHHGFHSSLLTSYCTTVSKAFQFFEPYLIPFLATVLGLWFYLARNRNNQKVHHWRFLMLVAELAAWLVMCFALMQKGCLHHTTETANVFFVMCLVRLCESAGFYFGQSRESTNRPSWRVLLILTTLLLLPLICAAGTANDLPFQCSVSLAPTLLLLFGISAVLNKQTESVMPTVMSVITCAILAGFQFYDGFVRHPYNLPNRLNNQTAKVTCENLKGLKLSPPEASFLEESEKILRQNGFKNGDLVLAFYHLPGLVSAVGGTSPIIAWYLPEAAYQDWNKHFVSKILLENKKKVFVVVEWKLDQNILSGLHDAGVSFPADFKLLGSVQNPTPLGYVDGGQSSKYQNGKTDIYELISKTGMQR